MKTTEKILYYASAVLLIAGVLLHTLRQIDSLSAVRLLTTGICFYGVDRTRYVRRLEARAEAMEAELLQLRPKA